MHLTKHMHVFSYLHTLSGANDHNMFERFPGDSQVHLSCCAEDSLSGVCRPEVNQNPSTMPGS